MNRILALQGGGCLGKGQAYWLAEYERINGQLCEFFDMVGGTSVGSINAACVAIGLPMSEANRFFDSEAPKIFKTSIWRKLGRIWDSAKYPADQLEKSLKSVFGEHTLADCKTRFIATSFDMASGRNVYFQSYGHSYESEDEIVIGPDSGMKLWQVCRASSAAQTYFPAFCYKGMVLWDGGNTGLNAPDMLVISEAKNDGLVISGLEMLSLGSGNTKWNRVGSEFVNPNLAAAMVGTLQIVFAAPEQSAVWLAAQELGRNYTRINPNLPEVLGIDDASRRSMLLQEAAWSTVFPKEVTE